MNQINLKNCKNCLASKQEESLNVGYCEVCVRKAFKVVQDYLAFHVALSKETNSHEND